MILRAVFKLFGMTPEPELPPESDETWRCPTCHTEHRIGTYRYGRIVSFSAEAISRYIDGEIDIHQLEVVLERARIRERDRVIAEARQRVEDDYYDPAKNQFAAFGNEPQR